MTEHRAAIRWRRSSEAFTYESFNRAHAWHFDGGVVVPASAAPAYRGEGGRVDPEQALVAALSSCHMLSFLTVAARKRFVVESYEDDAVGTLEKNEAGRWWVSRVVLHPRIVFAQPAPSADQLARLHALAHDNCFIASSVKSEVVVAPA